MDFTPTEAQRDLAGLARTILGDWVDAHDRPADAFDPDLWASLARAGLLDAALPAATGGGGFGLLEQCSILTEIGRSLAPAPYLGSITGAAATVADAGDGRLAERWLLPVARGERTLAVALADQGAAPGLTAVRSDEGWRLDGVHPVVPGGRFADGFLCEASTVDGSALFLVDRGADGVAANPQEVVDGADAAQLELSGVAVDPPLGGPERVRQRMTVGVCAHQLGVLEHALELTARYAREREQFGAPIGSFQAVRQRLADAYLDVEAVRLTLWQAAWQLAADLPADVEVATAKFWAAEAGHRVAHTCVHIHGGVGIDVDYPMHRYFVAAKRNEFALGAATAQLRAIGTALAEDPA